MRSKINWKANLWAHLWGVFLIRLTDVENPLQMWVEPSNGGTDVRGSKRQTFAFCILAFKSHCQVHLTSSGVHLSPHCYYQCHSLPHLNFQLGQETSDSLEISQTFRPHWDWQVQHSALWTEKPPVLSLSNVKTAHCTTLTELCMPCW